MHFEIRPVVIRKELPVPLATVSSASASTTHAESRTDRGTRLSSIDIFRGLIMVWMALDHTRDFFTNIRFEPESIDLTWPGLFFPRWIKHFCAPMFSLFPGPAAFLHRH